MEQPTAEQVEQALGTVAQALASMSIPLPQHQQLQQALGVVAQAARTGVAPSTNGAAQLSTIEP